MPVGNADGSMNGIQYPFRVGEPIRFGYSLGEDRSTEVVGFVHEIHPDHIIAASHNPGRPTPHLFPTRHKYMLRDIIGCKGWKES